MSAPSDQPEKTYRGSCHCGAFVYEATIPEIKSVMNCTCSICVKKGNRYTFSSPDKFAVVKGDEDLLTKYQFGSKNITYMFCGTCGSQVIGKGAIPGGKPVVALNIRCIQGLSLDDIDFTPFDGASALEPKYVPTPYTGPEPAAEIDGAKIYTGSCHCGAVTLALKSEPLDENYQGQPILDCDCSICFRNANVWLYVRKDQIEMQGRENLTNYAFGHRTLSKPFCRTCGINPRSDWLDMTPEALAALPQADREYREAALDYCGVNLRMLDGFDLGKLKIQHVKGSEKGVPYVNP